MRNITYYFLIYFIAINFITMIIYGIDKFKAKHHHYRIPERVLIGLAFIGGSIGAIIGMNLFHHKTQKMKFVIGVPAILVMQIGTFILLYSKVLK